MNACVLAVALLGTPLLGHAAGFGKMTVLSNLGQPFKAEIDLVSVQPEEKESLAVRLPSQDTFQDRGVDYSGVVRSMHFDLATRADGTPYIKVTSSQAVNDPYVDLLVEMSWAGGRIVRQYTELVDPANYSSTASGKQAVVNVPQAPSVDTASVAPRTPKAVVAATPLPPVKASSGIRHHHAPRRSAPAARRAAPVATAPTSAEAPAAPASNKESAAEHKVKSGETLGRIASHYRSGHVSLDQMLDGLYRDNGDAFINQNINRLKTGSILHVPTASEAAGVPTAEAERDIKAHTSDFNKYAQSVAATVTGTRAVKSSTGSTSTGGQVKAHAEDASKRSQNGPTDVAILTSGKTGGKGSKAEQKRAHEEDTSAAENEAKENATKVKLLEQQVHDLQDLLAKLKPGKNGVAANPSTKAVPVPVNVAPPAVTKPVATVSPPVKPAPAPAKPVEPVVKHMASAPVAAVTPHPVVKAPASAPAAVHPVAVKPAASKAHATVASSPVAETKHTPVVAASSAGAAKTASIASASHAEGQPVKHHVAPPVQEAPEEEDSGSNWLLIGGGVAAAALLGGLWFFMRRRRSRPSFEDSVLTGGDLKSNSVLGSVGGSIVDTSSTTDNSFFTDFSREGLGTIDTDEVDPVAEAEVYMAYGRDAQAEEILKDALIKDASRQEVRLKLLEIYANRKNLPNFELYATELHTATNGHGPLWEKAAAMGRELDPANSLYGMTESSLEATTVSGSDSTLKMSAVKESQPASADEADLDFELGTLKLDAATIQAQMAALGAPHPQVAPIDEANPMDFDLDDTPALPEESADAGLDFNIGSQTAPAADADSGSEAPILDFQFDLGDADAPAEEVAPDLQFSNTMGFHVKPVEVAAEPTVASPAVADGMEMDDLELDFPAGDAMEEPSFEVDAPPAPEHGDIKLDLGDLNLDLAAAETVEIAPEADLGFQLDDFDAADMPGPDDPVETKLDLAKAYIEMGDREGAREILTEAVGEGSDQQRQRAHDMLAKL